MSNPAPGGGAQPASPSPQSGANAAHVSGPMQRPLSINTPRQQSARPLRTSTPRQLGARRVTHRPAPKKK